MNYASDEQLRAVGQTCRYFNSVGKLKNTVLNKNDTVSCRICEHWDGERCVIDVFDNVLTSMDQT